MTIEDQKDFWRRRQQAIWPAERNGITAKTAQEAVAILVRYCMTEITERDAWYDDVKYGPWDTARDAASELLHAAKCDGLGGCPLCQS